MKAGTAQKMVLNMLTTATMVKLGKTYGNLMVDVQSTNAKLRERAASIVREAANLDEPEARAALAAADGEVKTAIVAASLQIQPGDARERLAATGGVVRRDEARHVDLGSFGVRFLLDAAQTGGALALVERAESRGENGPVLRDLVLMLDRPDRFERIEIVLAVASA